MAVGYGVLLLLGTIDVPAEHRDWLARLRLLPGRQVCAACGSTEIAYSTDDTQRERILGDLAAQRS